MDRHLESLRVYADKTMAELSAHDAHELEEMFEQGNPQIRNRVSAARAFVQRWWENVNFRRLFHNVHRAYNKDDHHGFREIMRDLICIWTPSHGTEVIGGVTAFLSTIFLFQPIHVIASTGLAAFIIAAPGFDPLCWVLVGGYLLSLSNVVFDLTSVRGTLHTAISPLILVSKIYAWIIRVLRKTITVSAVSVWRYSGMRRVAVKLFEMQTAHDYLLEDLILRSEPGHFQVRTVRETGSQSGVYEIRMKEKFGDHLEARCLFRENPDGSSSLMRVSLDYHELEMRVSNTLLREFNPETVKWSESHASTVEGRIRILLSLASSDEERNHERLELLLKNFREALQEEVNDLVKVVLKEFGAPAGMIARMFAGAHGTLRYSIADVFRNRDALTAAFRQHREEIASGKKPTANLPFYLTDVRREKGLLNVWFEPGTVHLRNVIRRRNRSNPVRSGGGGGCRLFVGAS